MLNKFKQLMIEGNYSYKEISDFAIELPFSKYSVIVHETLSDKLLVQIYNSEGVKVKSNSYKTLRGAKNFMIKYILENF